MINTVDAIVRTYARDFAKASINFMDRGISSEVTGPFNYPGGGGYGYKCQVAIMHEGRVREHEQLVFIPDYIGDPSALLEEFRVSVVANAVKELIWEEHNGGSNV